MALSEGEREIAELLSERDYWEDKAVELASLVSSHLGQDFGEHSSSNNPVDNAIVALTVALRDRKP